MAKYSLGTATTKIDAKMQKGEVYLDQAKATALKNDMVKQFENITASLNQIQTDLNKAVSKKVVKGSYADAFKGWGKKCKSQATAATKRKTTLSNKYNEDVKNFTIKLLSDRISRLESLISSMKSE
jgi:ribosomal protein S13